MSVCRWAFVRPSASASKPVLNRQPAECTDRLKVLIGARERQLVLPGDGGDEQAELPQHPPGRAPLPKQLRELGRALLVGRPQAEDRQGGPQAGQVLNYINVRDCATQA